MAEEEFPIEEEGFLDEGAEAAVPTQAAAPKRNSTMIIAGVIGLIVVISLVVFGFRMWGGDKSNNPNGPLTSEQIKEGKSGGEKKKKKKKIKFERLFSQLDGAQTSLILKELSFAGIPFSTEQAGKNFAVLVDKDMIDDARNMLAIKGLPAGSLKGYQLLDNAQTLGVTEFDKRVRFLRALSGELEKAIVQFQAIEDAKVQIVLPEERLFTLAQPPVTSSILVRSVSGMELNDDVVFSIIQLVSNAVENLQPENVSVIDTKGFVVSEGIFERLANRELGIVEEEPLPEPQIAPEKNEAYGEPIVPDFEQINQWFNVKKVFEKNLEEQATKQLLGVIPPGFFKVAVSSDIGPLENGQVADIKRLTLSIVTDSNNEDIELDTTTKQQIFQTAAGAIGYLRGRDQIILTKADFRLFSPDEQQELEQLAKEQQGESTTSPLLIWGGALIFAGVFIVGAFFFRRRKGNIPELTSSPLSDDGLGDPDFEGLQDEIQTDRLVEKLQSTIDSDADKVVQVIEKWLGVQPTEVTEEENELVEEVS